ncbi:MAG: hypothetical protein HKO08_06100 [Erythrobacter sp.]|nr:hypothetical protein [Erythrobacter sp.]
MRIAATGMLVSACISGAALAQDAPAADPFEDYRAGRYEQAIAGAETALESDSENAIWWALLAEARAQSGMSKAAAEAFASAARFETDPARRSYFLRAQALNLAYSGDLAAARLVIDGAMVDPALQTRQSLDWAMIAIAAGDDVAAQDILDNEALHDGFTRQTALDAGYSAKRRGLDRRAVRFFDIGLALDKSEEEPFSPEQREAIRRENRELTRDWSFLAQASYSTAGRPLGPALLDDEEALQIGAEVSRRIGGWRNGRPVSVFARAYLSDFQGITPAASNAAQGWIGLRYKPLASINFNLEASRLVGLDEEGLDDWSVRGAISGGAGLKPEMAARDWTYAHYYADVSYLFEHETTYALAEGRFGQSFLMDETSTTLTLYAVVRADFDSGRIEEEALGAGVGLSLRHWFDETDTVAHRGFVDLDIQARERIAGSERASGVLVTVTVGR